MNHLVDANVLSEATKSAPAAKVVDWLKRHEAELAVDPIILGEIRFGILLLPDGKRRQRLLRWFKQGVAKLTCLPWGAATGLRWAKLLADLRALKSQGAAVWDGKTKPVVRNADAAEGERFARESKGNTDDLPIVYLIEP